MNASARKITSGWSACTWAISHSQKLIGLVCGLSTRKTVTPCAIQNSDHPEDLGVEAGRVVVEVERVDVLVLLGRVLGVGDGAVRAGGEPLRVLGDPGMVGRALQREVERNLEAEVRGRGHEVVEVVDGAELRMDGVVPAGRGADGPRRPDVLRLRRRRSCCGPCGSPRRSGWMGGR